MRTTTVRLKLAPPGHDEMLVAAGHCYSGEPRSDYGGRVVRVYLPPIQLAEPWACGATMLWDVVPEDTAPWGSAVRMCEHYFEAD